jgi:hypothetical protein
LKQGSVQLALTDNRGESSGLEIIMHGNGNRDRSRGNGFLQDAMAPFLPDSNKAILLK